MGAGASTGPMPAATIRRFWDPAECYREGRRPKLHASRHTNEPLYPDCVDPDPTKPDQPLPEPGVDALGGFCVLGCGEGLARRVAKGKEALQRVRRAAGCSSTSKDAENMGELDRALGCILGNLVGDALGAPIEFTPVVYGERNQEARGVITGLDAQSASRFWHKETKIDYVMAGEDAENSGGYAYNSFNLALGQWTDDGSMALCLLDTLLCGGESRSPHCSNSDSTSSGAAAPATESRIPEYVCSKSLLDSCPLDFDPVDLRHRFHAWNAFGYNNSFGRDDFAQGSSNSRDAKKDGRGSVGLGRNIGQSVREWNAGPPTKLGVASTNAEAEVEEEEDNRSYLDLAFTRAGDQYTSGNGSLMRNSPVPVWYRDDVGKGMAAARAQSRTTHGGLEAAELCRLLTWVCTAFIKGGSKEEVLGDITGKKAEAGRIQGEKETEADGANGGARGRAGSKRQTASPGATARERRGRRDGSQSKSASAAGGGRGNTTAGAGSSGAAVASANSSSTSTSNFASLRFPPFRSPLYSVTCLANSEAESEEAFVHAQAHEDPFFGDLSCRDWNWRPPKPHVVRSRSPSVSRSSEKSRGSRAATSTASRASPTASSAVSAVQKPAMFCYRYAQQRVDANPGYAGSYSMDAMAMALHIVWTSQSFEEAALKAANLGGDADTVCAITAQMAGALWGVSAIPEAWVRAVDDRWAGGTVAARALMCFEREKLAPEAWRGEDAVRSAEKLGKPWSTT